MVASYVAMKSNAGMARTNNTHIDFAYIDRTFASLDNVAYWSAGIVTLLSAFTNTEGTTRTTDAKTCCYIDRQKFSQLLGKFISRVFRLVTLWKDNNYLTYAGIERSNSKYLLLGSDPVNDHIIHDLASLKNAHVRSLIYKELNTPHRALSKYCLNLHDYILKDEDVQEFG